MFPGGNLKKISAFIISLAGIICVFAFLKSDAVSVRLPASVPDNYSTLKACEKQELLWNKITESQYQKLPGYKKLGLLELISMARQGIGLKGHRQSDFAPEHWVKYLHRHGSVAKVKIIPVNSKYTGVFTGSECSLLRLSLTYKVTSGKPVAPGLALKILRDLDHPSANVSALVSLNGQKKDYNFFKNPMSNIVPPGSGIGQALVHKLFRRVTHYPEELLLAHLAELDVHGEKVSKTVSPRQVFFVPAAQLNFSSDNHDVRDDFMAIPEGTKLYELRAVPEKYAGMDYSEYTAAMAQTLVKESEHIADIVTTSEFVSSSFGDDGLFFRHQLRP
jgi:hypothetical protein